MDAEIVEIDDYEKDETNVGFIEGAKEDTTTVVESTDNSIDVTDNGVSTLENPEPEMNKDGNPIPPAEGFSIPLGGSGNESQYSKVFDIQKNIFENIDKDIASLKSAIGDIDELNEISKKKIDVLCDYIDRNDFNVSLLCKITIFLFCMNVVSLGWCLALTFLK